jgi:histidinol-phosphate/aromatic aminotransferase/cobyric acid decarboxylase-like protein/CTP:molybdopterin cytidylyltransferase MocA
MQAVILAAGRGRRMEPLSARCHKALLEIAGTTILGRALDSLLAAGVAPVTVVTGHREDDIVSFVTSRYPGAPVRFVTNHRYASTNNIVSLALALESISYDADVIVVECDLLFEPHLIAGLVAHPARNVALVDAYRTGMDGTVVATRDGYVSEVFPTARQDAGFRYDDKLKTLNLYRFDREFCRRTLAPMLRAYASYVDPNCYYELVLGMLANIPEHRIYAQPVDGSDWAEVDDPTDLRAARFLFDPAGRAAMLDEAFTARWSAGLLDFSLPANPYFPTPAMLAALRHSLPELATGYGSAQSLLDEKASYLVGCDPARIHLISGASAAYPLLRARHGGGTVLLPAPTFGEYPRCFPGARTYADPPGLSRDALAAGAASADLAVVVNPNNPTGSVLPTRALHDLAAALPGTTFCVDESFIAFSGQPSLVGLLEAEPLDNVVVLSSLGKSLGVPGLRLGYVYSASEQWRAGFRAELPIWGVNSVAEHFLELAIKYRTELAESIRLVVAERARLAAQLAAQPLVSRVHPSAANFLLADLRGGPDAAARTRAALLERDKIEVKDVTGRFPGGVPRLRITVRVPADNARLLTALGSLDLAEAR